MRTALPRFFESLPLIQARLGAYGVVGNNDRNESVTDLKTLTQAMKDAGVTPLVNEVASIRVGAGDPVYRGSRRF